MYLASLITFQRQNLTTSDPAHCAFFAVSSRTASTAHFHWLSIHHGAITHGSQLHCHGLARGKARVTIGHYGSGVWAICCGLFCVKFRWYAFCGGHLLCVQIPLISLTKQAKMIDNMSGIVLCNIVWKSELCRIEYNDLELSCNYICKIFKITLIYIFLLKPFPINLHTMNHSLTCISIRLLIVNSFTRYSIFSQVLKK